MATRAKRGELLAERAGEVYALAAAGWVIRDMATELGVSERTLYYSQRVRSDIAEALEQGRAEHVRRLAAKAAAAMATERAATAAAAQAVTALLGIAPAPAAPPVAIAAPLHSALPLDTQQGPGGLSPYPPASPVPRWSDDYGDDHANYGDALPLDDPE